MLKKQDESWKTNEKFDLSLPVLNSDGWYLVFEDDFEGTSLNENITFGEKYNGNKRNLDNIAPCNSLGKSR